MRVRNAATQAIHEYLQKENFLQIHTPILTSNDCEGAGELFQVTAADTKPNKCNFFGDASKSYLTVSGQLQAEMFASALSRVYSFGPTFRAEQSNTSRHLSEFWMLEPEMAFMDLDDLLSTIEGVVKYTTNAVLQDGSNKYGCADDLMFFDAASVRRKKAIKKKYQQRSLLNELQSISSKSFCRMTYSEAIEILINAELNGKAVFEYPVSWGLNLQSEHEKYIAEQYCNGPVFVTDYPSAIKPFYMRCNEKDEMNRSTVAAVDLLVPRLGELVGGSQREERPELLIPLMEQHGLLPQLEWYADLRRFGSVPHSGFGLGFERLLLFLTGLENIRDVIPIPRYPGFNSY